MKDDLSTYTKDEVDTEVSYPILHSCKQLFRLLHVVNFILMPFLAHQSLLRKWLQQAMVQE